KVLQCIGRLQAERAEAIDPRYTEVFPDAPTDVLNVGTISGGIALNMIAEECKLRVSYRSLPDADALALYNEAVRRISAIDLHDYALGECPATLTISPPMVVPPLNSPRKTALEAALFDIMGTSISGGAVFGTDGGWFELSGINSLICGPGDFAQAHQPNESISRAAFERGTDLILRVVDRMCC
ncbi:MAG TPA: M20/M25/M40 family metallo-hydrolase, partial [Candidatus Binataceae bacterium]|nr:M20/M25/M40 family metallo-hydrolase [Candidatus Binataceae bacterium]